MSYPALYTHQKQKHSRGPGGELRAPPTSGRGRGRPRKNVSLDYYLTNISLTNGRIPKAMSISTSLNAKAARQTRCFGSTSYLKSCLKANTSALRTTRFTTSSYSFPPRQRTPSQLIPIKNRKNRTKKKLRQQKKTKITLEVENPTKIKIRTPNIGRGTTMN